MSEKRNSRWGTAPILDRTGRPKHARLTERDIDGILIPLARYRYLPADYIHAFTGGSLDYLIDRLGLLAREPNLYLRRPSQQRASAAANHRRLIYELTERGARALQSHDLTYPRARPVTNFAHELMTCQVMASFDIGSRETGTRLIRWAEILASTSLPEATRQAAKPYAIPVAAVVNGQRLETHVVADGLPFGVAPMLDGRRRYFFCPGIEADCGTEPVDTSDLVRTSIYKKLVLYLAIEAQGLHRTHFGFPNLYVPFVTTTAARMDSMMRTLERATSGAGSKIFLFKTFPSVASFGSTPVPTGHMLTEPWQRVGHTPFTFLIS